MDVVFISYNYDIILYATIGILLIVISFSLIKKSIFPLNIVKIITGFLTALFAITSLILYSNISLAVLIFIALVLLVFSNSFNAIDVTPDFKPSMGGCGGIITIITVGFIMCLVFVKYLDFKIQANTKSNILDISLMLLVFCSILCATSWIMSLILKGLIVRNFGIAANNQYTKGDNQKSNESIKSLIANAKLSEAINELENILSLMEDESFEKTVVLLKLNLKEVEQKYNSNLIGIEEYQVEKARLSEKVLNLAKGK